MANVLLIQTVAKKCQYGDARPIVWKSGTGFHASRYVMRRATR
jgi:hypothetical protein